MVARERKANGGIDPPLSAKSSQPSCGHVATVIARKLLNSYSDQQIVTGIGIQSLGLAQIGELVPYHFFLIWMLGLLSTAVHNAALLALVHDFRRDCILRWLRQLLMLINLALSCVYGIYVLRELAVGLPQTLSIACAWDDGSTGNIDWEKTAGGFQFVATVVVIAGNCVVFVLSTWYLHSRMQRFYRIVQTVGLVLMGAVAIGVTIRVILLSQAFGHPSVNLSDLGETSWSFGQLLSLLMLLLPLISVIEIARGEVKLAPPVSDSASDVNGNSDTVPLVENVSMRPSIRNSIHSAFTKRR